MAENIHLCVVGNTPNAPVLAGFNTAQAIVINVFLSKISVASSWEVNRWMEEF